MKSYRQYCPIARASEIMAERWVPLIVRNLMFGAETFTQIARGVPAMSRSVLSQRLGELERFGIIETTPKPNGQGSLYRLTEAGEDLAGVIASLAVWGETWVEVTSEHSDPGFALWAWSLVQLQQSALPEGRRVVAFTFPDQAPGNRHYWLLIEHGDAEVCYSDPGGTIDVEVRATSEAFVNWHRGESTWEEGLRSGAISVTGDRQLARQIPTWNRHTLDPDRTMLARP